MGHYDLGRWSDYARGLAGGEARAAMTGHLGVGCGRCRRAVAALSRIAELAATDGRLTPDPGAMRSVKAIAAVRQADRLPARQRVGLQPVGGGIGEPAAAGVRGAAGAGRLTFGGAGLEVELLLGSAPASEALVLEGELRELPSHRLPGVPAFLVSGSELVDQAVTDELGAFHLTGEVDQARLCLYLPDDRLVALDLDAAPPSGVG